MAQSLVRNLVHLVYGTKQRKTWLRKEIRSRLFTYQATILRSCDCQVIAIDGYDEHVHSLFALTPCLALKDVVQQLKRDSSKWMKSNGGVPNFQWQNGYAAFSVSESVLPRVHKYILTQEEHHRRMSYTDELRMLLESHGLASMDPPQT